jgi:hypothetical protein
MVRLLFILISFFVWWSRTPYKKRLSSLPFLLVASSETLFNLVFVSVNRIAPRQLKNVRLHASWIASSMLILPKLPQNGFTFDWESLSRTP